MISNGYGMKIWTPGHLVLFVVASWLLLFSMVAMSETTEEKHETLEQAIVRNCPNVNAAAVLEFYQSNAPDLLKEVEKRMPDSPNEMDRYIKHLVDHFLDVEKVRQEDAECYAKLLAQEKIQLKVRQLSRQIQELSKADKNESPEEKTSRLEQLQTARQNLKELLESVFDEAQLMQEQEITRLESEVVDLKRLAIERNANRMFILKERFYSLTGQEWPEQDDKP